MNNKNAKQCILFLITYGLDYYVFNFMKMDVFKVKRGFHFNKTSYLIELFVLTTIYYYLMT